MKQVFQWRWLAAIVAVGLVFGSCKKKDPEAVSGFTAKADAANFLKIDFTSTATNAVTHAWDFGDGGTSTETNPSHTYASTGTFTVKLTVTGSGGDSDVATNQVTVVDPDAELGKLAGLSSKTWKLLRVVKPGRWPLEVGPIAKDQVWWAQGRDNDEIANRPCIMNDSWTFTRDGKMQYRTNGDYWAEGGVFDPANDCRSSAAGNMTGPNGSDLSAFGDGDHTFVLTPGTKPTLEVKGLGAFVGLPKIGTDFEVKVPQTSVKLDIVKLYDGPTCDTLILESDYKWATTDTEDKAYWKITLVSYDNAANEPAIPTLSAQPSFTVGQDKLTVTVTNTSKNASSYVWDFGDGATATTTDATHTYAAAGEYVIKLTATSSTSNPVNATVSTTQNVTVTTGVITEADIVGGAWKVRKAANSVFVGDGLGKSNWWATPLEFLDGTKAGTTDDWSCMPDDEFIFTAGGKYEYKTNGGARNDGYMGTPNGCWSDAQIAGSGNGAAFGSGVHSYQFVPATGTERAKLILTNGASGAAFIGFYKGYYGGENSDGTKAPNGGNSTNTYEIISYVKTSAGETLTVSVDISAAKNGSAAWSAVLVR